MFPKAFPFSQLIESSCLEYFQLAIFLDMNQSIYIYHNYDYFLCLVNIVKIIIYIKFVSQWFNFLFLFLFLSAYLTECWQKEVVGFNNDNSKYLSLQVHSK